MWVDEKTCLRSLEGESSEAAGVSVLGHPLEKGHHDLLDPVSSILKPSEDLLRPVRGKMFIFQTGGNECRD